MGYAKGEIYSQDKMDCIEAGVNYNTFRHRVWRGMSKAEAMKPAKMYPGRRPSKPKAPPKPKPVTINHWQTWVCG